nr:hypothetical protein [Paenibacillus xylanexedens]
MSRWKHLDIVKLTVEGVELDAKECTKCGEVKVVTEFRKNSQKKSGYESACKVCRGKKGLRADKVQVEYLIVTGESIAHKRCTKCLHLLPLAKFSKGSGAGNKQVKCKECQSIYKASNKERYKENGRRYYKLNRASIRKQTKSYYEQNKDRIASIRFERYTADKKDRKRNYDRVYRVKNQDKTKKHDQIKRTRMWSLPYNLTKRWLQKVESISEGECVYAREINTNVDHFIPLATGHCGTYLGNLSLLSRTLNNSKKDKNPFEWFEANRQRFELDQVRFDALVGKLAAQNGLTPEEFRKFTYWCFDNPRTVEQIAADNARYGYKKSSLEIWREQTGLPFPIAVDFGNTTLNNDITRKEDAA